MEATELVKGRTVQELLMQIQATQIRNIWTRKGIACWQMRY